MDGKSETSNIVYASQVDLLDKGLRFGLIASLFNAVLLSWAQWSVVNLTVIMSWLSLLSIVLAIRFGISVLYRSRKDPDLNVLNWGRISIIMATFTGVIWGAAGILLTPADSLPHQMLTVFILAGMAAGALSSLYPLQSAFGGYVIASLLPLIIKCFWEGSFIYMVMGITASLFLLFLLVSAKRLRAILIETLFLRHEKQNLIGALGKEEEVRRKIEALSNWNQRKYQQVIENAGDAIFVYDANGHFLEVNSKACELLGYSKNDLLELNMSALEIEDEKDKFRQMLRDIDIQSFPLTFEKICRKKNGSTVPVEVRVAIFSEKGPPEFVALARDISDRKETDRLKNEFVSTVSHELRTPLTSIVGALDYLLEYSKEEILKDEIVSIINIADRNARRLTDLVNEILDFEKLESGQANFQIERIDLKAFLQEACNINQIYAETHSAKLSLKEQIPHIFAEGDPKRLMQVMNNLISNAIKFSANEGIVTLSLEVVSGRAKITVSDNGPGIPKEFSDRLFQRFSQGHSEDSRGIRGTGLGLPIAKNIVESLGGLIDFKSELGKGTQFFVELPQSHP